MPGKLNAPIPGQSLTTEPGNAPWEQPPLYSNVQQALAFYLQKLEDPDLMEDMFFILDQEVPVSILVESMTTTGVMEGVHTVDVSVLIKPVIHEFIVTLAEAAGVTVVEDDGPNESEKIKAKEKKRLLVILQNQFADDFSQIPATETVDDPSAMPEEPLEGGEPPSTGLIPRRPA